MRIHGRRTIAVAAAIVAVLHLVPSAYALEAPAATEAKHTKVPEPVLERLGPITEAALEAAAVEEPDPVEIVIEEAHAQIGTPYRWAGESPSGFDCSGFTKYVWGKVGVHLPHNSGAQRSATQRVSLAEVEVGDLIFSPGHVGLYIGEGKMIHAPRRGKRVEIAPMHSRAYTAGRPRT